MSLPPSRGQEDNSWMGYLSKAVSTTASYLPAQVTDTLNQTRAVATLTVPNSPVIAPNTVAIANISRQTRLLLASSDGYLYIYNLPGEQEQRHTLFIIPSNYFKRLEQCEPFHS